VQQQVLTRDPTLAGCEVPPARTHLTAFVLHCAEAADEARAREALRSCALLLDAASPPPRLPISGLGNFGTRVLFVSVPPCEDLLRVSALVDDVAECFRRAGIDSMQHEAGGWSPHVTLLKVSRVRGFGGGRRGRRRRPPSIDVRKFADLDADMGVHALSSIELCAMQGQGVDGFYRVEEGRANPDWALRGGTGVAHQMRDAHAQCTLAPQHAKPL